MWIRRAGIVMALLTMVSQRGAAQAAASGMSDAAGLYTLHTVNKVRMPSQTWKRQASDTTCMTTTQNGTLMLDSRGRWALLVTERDRCTRATKRWTAPDVSSLSTGTYTVDNGMLMLTDAATSTTHHAMLGKNDLTVTVAGSDPFAGQQATYVLRRSRPTRPTKS